MYLIIRIISIFICLLFKSLESKSLLNKNVYYRYLDVNNKNKFRIIIYNSNVSTQVQSAKMTCDLIRILEIENK